MTQKELHLARKLFAKHGYKSGDWSWLLRQYSVGRSESSAAGSSTGKPPPTIGILPGVGKSYEDFSQTTDEEVRELAARAAQRS